MGTFIKYELGKINNKDVIFIRFAYDAELVARVKKLVGAQWSQTQHAWYVPANTAYLKNIIDKRFEEWKQYRNKTYS